MTILAGFCAAVSIAGLACLFVNLRSFVPMDRAAPSRWPRVSVLIPARNEERGLERAVRSHLGADYPDFEVVVVNDCSTDGTGEILRRLAMESPRLAPVEGAEPPAGWLGKPHALWQAARRSTGEWLLFVDADVEYSPRALRDAVGHVLARRLDLLALLPRALASGFWETVLMPNLYALLFLGPGFLYNRDSFRRGALGGGSGILVSRAAYEASGGHEALRNSVIDDIGLATLVRRAGLRARAARAFDRVQVRMYRGLGEIIEGFTKNVAYVLPQSWMVAFGVLFFWVVTFAPWVLVLRRPFFAPAPVLAAFAIGGLLAGRLAVARLTRMAPWSALFHPLMVAVWGWIGLRSAWRRSFRGRVEWRGRITPAREAR